MPPGKPLHKAYTMLKVLRSPTFKKSVELCFTSSSCVFALRTFFGEYPFFFFFVCHAMQIVES